MVICPPKSKGIHSSAPSGFPSKSMSSVASAGTTVPSPSDIRRAPPSTTHGSTSHACWPSSWSSSATTAAAAARRVISWAEPTPREDVTLSMPSCGKPASARSFHAARSARWSIELTAGARPLLTIRPAASQTNANSLVSLEPSFRAKSIRRQNARVVGDSVRIIMVQVLWLSVAVADGDDSLVFRTDDGVDPRQCINLLRPTHGAPKHRHRVIGHHVADAASTIELALAVGQDQRHGHLVDTSLLGTLVRVAGEARFLAARRFIMVVAVGQNSLRQRDMCHCSTLRRICKAFECLTVRVGNSSGTLHEVAPQDGDRREERCPYAACRASHPTRSLLQS